MWSYAGVAARAEGAWRLGMRWELMCLLAHHVFLCRATVGTVARRKKLAPPMGWVTRLGAKGPANVARFRGGTASQRYGSKRSRCATPPKVLKNRMCGITSKFPPPTITHTLISVLRLLRVLEGTWFSFWVNCELGCTTVP